MFLLVWVFYQRWWFIIGVKKFNKNARQLLWSKLNRDDDIGALVKADMYRILFN